MIGPDPAYAEAAARRRDRRVPDRPAGLTGLTTAGVVLVVGLVLGTAAATTQARAPAARQVRRELLAEAERRTALTDTLQRRQAALRQEAAAARDDRLRASEAGRLLASALRGLELYTGDIPVRGPGIEVRLDDAAGAGGAEDPLENGRIRDRDIQEVVNAVWAAGAEAVAVNGQRVTVLTAIREAGQAILVDYRPLSPPYVVSAVGDPDTMEPAFADSVTARRFRTWVSAHGLSFEVHRRSGLQLPAAETSRLRHAKVDRR